MSSAARLGARLGIGGMLALAALWPSRDGIGADGQPVVRVSWEEAITV